MDESFAHRLPSGAAADTSATAANGLETVGQPASAGASYTVTGRVNVVSGSPSLYVRFWNASGDVLTSAATGYSGPNGVWSPLSATLTAPTGTVKVTALLYSSIAGTSTAYWDTVRLTRTAEVTVPDYGFENGLGGWSQYGPGGNTASTDRAFTGTTSAKLVDTSTTTATGLESLKVPGAAGVRYNAVARVYVQSGAPSIYVRYYNAAGTLLSSTAADFAGALNSWQWLKVAGTSPVALAEHISGRDLGALFTAWLYTPTKPPHP